MPSQERVTTTDPARSALMKRVRQAGTTPELVVRRMLTAMGARYRLNATGLPGRPDIVNRSRKKAVFVHGCFWHAHETCGRGRIPATNRGFWTEKFERNVERDVRKVRDLRSLGFDVLVLWECELKDEAAAAERLRAFWFGAPDGVPT